MKNSQIANHSYFLAILSNVLLLLTFNLLAERYVKFTMKLRYMWLRSIISSALGQFIFIVMMGIFTSLQVPFSALVKGSLMMFGILIVMTGLLTYPASITIAVLKPSEE